ncbi:hypothetical protein EYF80_029655 [Liparis tanakae]|uniref:Uncharacterized protein n=1 Tax=Liparis tanakae TaxID=230148 RepID=A0A4Z2H4T8_9TELE|nr:hypothetical protein EYF80_029655 [Liparis tanakae]
MTGKEAWNVHQEGNQTVIPADELQLGPAAVARPLPRNGGEFRERPAICFELRAVETGPWSGEARASSGSNRLGRVGLRPSGAAGTEGENIPDESKGKRLASCMTGIGGERGGVAASITLYRSSPRLVLPGTRVPPAGSQALGSTKRDSFDFGDKAASLTPAVDPRLWPGVSHRAAAVYQKC